jgi:hypothetical protein
VRPIDITGSPLKEIISPLKIIQAGFELERKVADYVRSTT